MHTAAQFSIDDLRAELAGPVIGPDDPGYDAARGVVLRSVDRRPAAIVRPVDAGEVSRVVSLASDEGLELAVRGGGHSYAGHGASEGGIVLDLRALNALDVDPGERVARAAGGLTSGDVTTAAAQHGLAVGFGDTATVGIGGLTLGGGAGYLVRKHGLTIDHLLSAQVVTADGRVLEVDEAHEPDLFWAIRGGGGNFGVVTRFDYRLHPVGTVTGGLLALEGTPETIAGLVEIADAAPDELSVIANVLPAPPLPFVPPERVGRPLVLALLVHAGSLDDGAEAVAPLRALPTAGCRLRARAAVQRDVRAGGAGGAASCGDEHVLLRLLRRGRRSRAAPLHAGVDRAARSCTDPRPRPCGRARPVRGDRLRASAAAADREPRRRLHLAAGRRRPPHVGRRDGVCGSAR